MEDKFKEIEKAFERLKKKYWLHEISQQEFRDNLKKMKVKDKNEVLWMIGSRSGRWYYFDGHKWIQSEPPYNEGEKKKCPYCGFENYPDTDVCVRCGESLKKEMPAEKKEEVFEEEVEEEVQEKEKKEEKKCPYCGHILEKITDKCPYCDKILVEKDQKKKISEGKEEDYVVLNSINPKSLFLFLGAIGILSGIIIGAFAGTTEYFSNISEFIPLFLQEFQGKLLGGIIYAAVGGIAGFLLLGILGFFIALFGNILFYFIGGIKLKFTKLNK